MTMTRHRLPWIFAAVLLIGCGAANDRREAGRVVSANGGENANPAAAADMARMKGDTNAPLWLIVASDFQCPYCRLWHQETEPLIVREYVNSGRVRMAFVNFPLGNHRNAMPAAEAAMCAGAQGRFWPVHDAIFAAQQEWSADPAARQRFSVIAQEHVPDMVAWRDCVQTGTMRPLIEADRDRAASAGVQSTPTFFLNGRPIVGAQPFEVFRREIDAALAAAGSGGSD